MLLAEFLNTFPPCDNPGHPRLSPGINNLSLLSGFLEDYSSCYPKLWGLRDGAVPSPGLCGLWQ